MMSSKDYTTWLKGFIQGVGNTHITPDQWSLLKSMLDKVDDNEVENNKTILHD